jgi:7-cyano-7-deazaguanine reductase
MSDPQLGRKVKVPYDDPKNVPLDTLPSNNHSVWPHVVRFTCPEFTSLCPVTGAPDFARIVIDYIPQHLLVESKSLKLYLGAFRNHGIFHEDGTIAIGMRLVSVLDPVWFRIAAFFQPRGGIPIDVFWNRPSSPPAGVWIPDLNLEPYRGR